MMKSILLSTNAQNVLGFLIEEPGYQFLAKEIEKKTKISCAGVNFAVRNLTKAALINRERKGSIYLYSVDTNHPVIKQLKILKTTVRLFPLIQKLKSCAKKIILFGSCSRGENKAKSDIDLFILSDGDQAVQGIVNTYISKSKLNIQPIIKDATKFYSLEKSDPVFFEEINRGQTLWESYESRIRAMPQKK